MSEANTTQADSITSDVVSELKRKFKSQSLHFSNEKLLLEHKNELLRKELIELKERELNQAKLHESMFNKSKHPFPLSYKYSNEPNQNRPK
jgi:RNA polymerase-interacting CarD/CdnL/TRCF family regulator